jgi:hypothetical protein
MTSLKKPLIAIASAIALATTAFVAPASAAVTFTLTGGDSATKTGATEALAISLPVPTDNNVTTADVLRIDLAGVDNNTTVTAVATDAKLSATVGSTVLPSSGTTSATVATGTGTVAGFNVFTTSTKTGKVVVTVGTATPVTYYVKGTNVAADLNNIVVSAPTAALGTTAKITVTGTDVFGNLVSGASVSLNVISSSATNNYALTTAADGTAVKELSGLTVDTYDFNATATVATAIAGLTKPAGFVKGQLKVVDLAVALAEKDATIASLKAKYNSLVKKYNKKVTKKYRVKAIN